MNKNILQALSNASLLTRLFIVLFMLGVLFSCYALYSLPHDLVYYGNVANVSLASGIFLKLSLAVIVTFLLGMAAIAIAIQVKKETIVYIEKKKSEESQQTLAESNEIQTFDLESFDRAMAIGASESARMQNGLNKICDFADAGQGAIYTVQISDEKREVELTHGYALAVAETAAPRFEFGEGLVGQVAASGQSAYLDEIPEGYITIVSGLGTSSPRYLLVLPLINGAAVKGVLEVATFQPMADAKRKQLEEMARVLAKRLN